MFENPRRGRQARNFTTNVTKILDLKSSSEQIFFGKLTLGAPEGTGDSEGVVSRKEGVTDERTTDAPSLQYIF